MNLIKAYCIKQETMVLTDISLFECLGRY